MRQKADTKTIDDVHAADCQSQMEALNRSHCILELDPEGIILTANANFLNLLGYTLKEMKGEHHHVFMDEAYADSEEYQATWRSIRQGNYPVAECKWLNKKGSEVWLQASYNAIQDKAGRGVRVMQLARDITADRSTRQIHEA